VDCYGQRDSKSGRGFESELNSLAGKRRAGKSSGFVILLGSRIAQSKDEIRWQEKRGQEKSLVQRFHLKVR
jgi:hypothetical protein